MPRRTSWQTPIMDACATNIAPLQPSGYEAPAHYYGHEDERYGRYHGYHAWHDYPPPMPHTHHHAHHDYPPYDHWHGHHQRGYVGTALRWRCHQ
jgi:hypothetical protein